MDAVFGKDNFRNEIIWKRFSSHNDGNRYGNISDSILFYTKSKTYTWNKIYTPYSKEYIKENYNNKDEKGYFTHRPLTAESLSGGGYKYNFHGHTRIWKRPKDSMKTLEDNGLIYLPKKEGGIPRYKIYLDNAKGNPLQNIWTDISNVSGKERMGYPTQKPLELYERIIMASSQEGDIVLDPFAGCATTCVGAERLNRQWVGIDIWNKAHEVVIERMKNEGLIAIGGKKQIRQAQLFEENIIFSTTLPKRTDDGQMATPFLKVKHNVLEPHDNKMNRAEMVEYLLKQEGSKCQGCNRIFDDSRYLELDHNTPRADGGINHISNRILLCSPCNKLKRHYYTLSGLRGENKKHGYMAQ